MCSYKQDKVIENITDVRIMTIEASEKMEAVRRERKESEREREMSFQAHVPVTKTLPFSISHTQLSLSWWFGHWGLLKG